MLHQKYGNLLPYPNRLTFVDSEYRCWRPGDTVDEVASHGQCWIVPTIPLQGGRPLSRRKVAARRQLQQARQVWDQTRKGHACTVHLCHGRRVIPYKLVMPENMPIRNENVACQLNKRRELLGLSPQSFIIFDQHKHPLPTGPVAQANYMEADKNYHYYALMTPKLGAAGPPETVKSSRHRRSGRPSMASSMATSSASCSKGTPTFRVAPFVCCMMRLSLNHW